jgi:predicted short-subunit dehydrogenase-like oxidoreductase (DUF2520 family)
MIETAAVLGGGAVARALLEALPAAGVRVLASWHRRSGLQPPPLRDVDVVLLAVSDVAIAEVCGRIDVGPGQLVVHLAGALGLSPLASARRRGARVGSFHPLKPFTRDGARGFAGFAAGIRASDEGAAGDLAQLAVRLGMTPLLTADKSRPLYHAAAMLAAGGQVALFAEAVRTFRDATGLPEPQARAALLPLALGALEELRREPPERAITGPAARGDLETVASHRKALSGDLLRLYDQLSRVTERLRTRPAGATPAPVPASRSSHPRHRRPRAARPSASLRPPAPRNPRPAPRRPGRAPRRPR